MSEAVVWNRRYQGDEFAYGIEPNRFLVEQLDLIKGPVLSLSEGEGRNIVFLARQNLEVLGVDIAEVGLRKAEKLAARQGVKINTLVADLADFVPYRDHYRTVISIWSHLPSEVRRRLYPRIKQALKKDGVIVMIGYSEKQLEYGTGGPKDLDMLLSVEKVRQEWADFEPLLLEEREMDIREGKLHTGMASVVCFVGRKR